MYYSITDSKCSCHGASEGINDTYHGRETEARTHLAHAHRYTNFKNLLQRSSVGFHIPHGDSKTIPSAKES